MTLHRAVNVVKTGVRFLRCAADHSATHVQLTCNWHSNIPIAPRPRIFFFYIYVEHNHHFLILTQLRVSFDDGHHQATNKNSESKVQYNAGIFTAWAE